MKRIGEGRYVVPSSSQVGVAYAVQVNERRGVCDCIGSEGATRAGNQCRHVKAAIAAERDHMTTAVAKREEQYEPMVVEAPSSPLPTMDEMKVMVTIANSVYKTSGKLIPANIKTSEEAFAIMLAGREMGIPPMASFREVYVVNGRTMPSARVLMGLVQAGDPGAIFTWYERTEKKAHVRLTRSNGQVIEVEYTLEDAKIAGLLKNEVWTRFPKDMLAYKAVTRACRLGGADLITGIGASIKGAPAVMQAIEEDGDDMPVLEANAEEVANGHTRIAQALHRAAELMGNEDGKYDAWANGIKQRFPKINEPLTLTEAEANELADAIEADLNG